MNRKIEEVVEENIKENIEKLGFEIEYIEFVKEGENNILRIVIDKDGTVSIDDCETVSRAIEEKIDNHINTEYVLEVSSPGIERQLKNVRLYKKYIGSQIYIKLFKKLNNVKEYVGILSSVDENSITLKIDDQNMYIELKDIASAHTVYDFSSELNGNKNVNLNELKKF